MQCVLANVMQKSHLIVLGGHILLMLHKPLQYPFTVFLVSLWTKRPIKRCVTREQITVGQVSGGQSILTRGLGGGDVMEAWRLNAGAGRGIRRERGAGHITSGISWPRVIDGEELTSRAPNVTLQLNNSHRWTAASPPSCDTPPSSPPFQLSLYYHTPTLPLYSISL